MNSRFTYIRTKGTSDAQTQFQAYMMYLAAPESRPISLEPAEKDVNEFLSYCRDLEMQGWSFDYGGVVSAIAPTAVDSFDAGKILVGSFGRRWGGKWIRS